VTAALGALADERRLWRRRGLSVVFTNGCFDLLHAGHIALLERARAEGDMLVVGLNSDASVRVIKGETRPVMPEAERAETLLSVEAVDRVVLYDESTPLRLIRALQPDVLVKGADWRDKGVVGREVVEARGGRVVLLPLLEGRSTTEVLRRLSPPPPLP
jgi:D-beta-D-heptose 7-phosphate kinase/D-beta-D-heptose 1-phosphate adenosyltransferase